MFRKVAYLLFLLALYLHVVYAARPLNTDDARIVSKNHCQMETWIEIQQHQNSEIWALPACNLFWNTEITLGGMVGLQTDSIQFQVKKLFVNADEKNWGIGIAFGNIYNHVIGADNSNDIYAYIPATLELLDSRLIFHANIGYNLNNFKQGIYNVGLATEVQLLPKVYFIGEVYYSRFSPVMYQVGLRSWLIEDILQLDSTYGNSVNGDMSFISIGLRILPQQTILRNR